jgi:hypothetical protein
LLPRNFAIDAQALRCAPTYGQSHALADKNIGHVLAVDILNAGDGVIESDMSGARVRLRGAVDEANLCCALQALRVLA